MSTFPRTNRSRVAWLAGAVAVAAVTIGIGWGLASGGQPTERTLSAPEPTATGTGTPATPTPDTAGTPTPPHRPGSQTGGSQTGGGQPSGGPPAAGPQIEVFRVAQEPLCPRGTTQHPIDGRPLVLEWRATGTETVTLSIDGPGVYDTYPADSSDTPTASRSFSFSCAGREGDIERHTYLLTATGEGQTVTEELVVEAVVHEVTPV